MVACTQLSDLKVSSGLTPDDHKFVLCRWLHFLFALHMGFEIHACCVQITLIDQNEQFVFKPLLYELINGGASPDEVAPFFADLVGPMSSTRFIQVLAHQGFSKYHVTLINHRRLNSGCAMCREASSLFM